MLSVQGMSAQQDGPELFNTPSHGLVYIYLLPVWWSQRASTCRRLTAFRVGILRAGSQPHRSMNACGYGISSGISESG